jgi:4-amino-4-deoxy-L-arabinose transferase-like glycosyltransferase
MEMSGTQLEAAQKPDSDQASGEGKRPDLRATGVLCFLILLGLGLRLARFSFQPLWWDEGYSVWFATHSLSQMAALTAQDIHPPLYYALLAGWTALLGTGATALRLLSAALGVLAIPLFYLAARRMVALRAALLAAFLLTISPLHVYYSQEVRMYGLVALLSVGILAAAWRVFEQRGGGAEVRRSGGAGDKGGRPASARPFLPLLLYVLLTTAALYTQYYAAFLPIGLTLYAVWRWRRDRRALLTWFGAQVVIVVLYLPWVLYAAPKLAPYVSQKIVADADRPLGALAYLARHLSAFTAGHLEGPLAHWWPAALAFVVPIAIGVWLAARPRMARSGQAAEDETPRTAGAVPLLVVVVLAALLLGWLISLRAPFFPARGERLLILALPPFLLLAAAGLDALWARWRAAGITVLILIAAASAASLAAFYTVPRYADDDYRALIAHTVEQGAAGDTVFAVYPWQVGYWRSYGSPEGPAARLSPDPEWTPAVAAALDDALRRGRVWFPAHVALGGILEKQIEAYLAGRAVPVVNEWHGPNTRLSAWAAVPGGDRLGTAPVRFSLPGSAAGSLELSGVTAARAPVEAANAVTPIALQWLADAPPPALGVSIRLTDALGQIWAQHDYEPLGGSTAGAQGGDAGGWQATDRVGLLVPAGTPPGRYTVELLVQPTDSERPLEASAADGRRLGTSAPLFELDVAPADRPVGPERLPIAVREQVDLGDGLRFLGHSADDAPIVPGELRKVSLFWQAAARPASDYVAFVQVLGRDGAPVALWEAPPGAAYPTSQWADGTLMRTQASLRVPASVPDGRYRLIAGLFRAGDKTVLRTKTGSAHLSLGTITVRGRPHEMTQPRSQYPADATFGDVARLIGTDLVSAETRPGGTLDLTLHWQALGSTERPYTVFLHLLDEAGNVKGYGDSEPGGRAYPTTGWIAGEYLTDPHTVTVASDASPGTYRLAVGVYDPVTGERLKMPDGDDQVVLDIPITLR